MFYDYVMDIRYFMELIYLIITKGSEQDFCLPVPSNQISKTRAHMNNRALTEMTVEEMMDSLEIF